jgi:hypothetical protein
MIRKHNIFSLLFFAAAPIATMTISTSCHGSLHTSASLHSTAQHALTYSSDADESLSVFLSDAITRGVPLFNNGNPTACAATYETAVDALLLHQNTALSGQEIQMIERERLLANGQQDPSSRAWAYRAIIDAVLQPRMHHLMPDKGESISVLNTKEPGAARQWNVVLDGVMGGKSTGTIQLQQDNLVFEGETSLRNNGGFSSIRAAINPGSLMGYDTIRLRVKGDGRKWIFGARKSTRMGADSYWADFQTKDKEWMTVDIPVQSMVRHIFGQKAPGSITPGEIEGIEFYIYDKNAGDFRLEIGSIEAVAAGPNI